MLGSLNPSGAAPSTVSFEYSGQSCPEPSDTEPTTVPMGAVASAKSWVTVSPAVTVTVVFWVW